MGERTQISSNEFDHTSRLFQRPKHCSRISEQCIKHEHWTQQALFQRHSFLDYQNNSRFTTTQVSLGSLVSPRFLTFYRFVTSLGVCSTTVHLVHFLHIYIVRLQWWNTGLYIPHTSMAGALLRDSLGPDSALLALFAAVAVSVTFRVTVADIFL